MTISSQLRAAIKATDATLYRIAKDAEVDWGTLKRFVDGMCRTFASTRWTSCASNSG